MRRRYAHGLSLLANYTLAKSLTNAPDFRSPMYESSIPQNDDDLQAERGPACDIRNRFSLSGVYDAPAWNRSHLSTALTKDWRFSTIYQVQSGYPMTISVFGDTANAGTALGENPIRANSRVRKSFLRHAQSPAMVQPRRLRNPARVHLRQRGRNSVYGPGMQTFDVAVVRAFSVTERMRLETRGEFFNALNQVNYDVPNRFVNTAGFGTITGAMSPGRQIQLSARVSF